MMVTFSRHLKWNLKPLIWCVAVLSQINITNTYVKLQLNLIVAMHHYSYTAYFTTFLSFLFFSILSQYILSIFQLIVLVDLRYNVISVHTISCHIWISKINRQDMRKKPYTYNLWNTCHCILFLITHTLTTTTNNNTNLQQQHLTIHL